MSNNDQHVLKTEDLRKEFVAGELSVAALQGVSLEVKRGEFMGIIGPSGSGKSTLLGLIGGLDTPTSGRVFIDNIDITEMNERALTRVRNEKIGFVFQTFNLIPTLTALENVSLPLQFASNRKYEPRKRAEELLTLFGLGDRLNHRPSQLSGGEQQRVAISRALANNPPLLLADEATGNLDTASSEVVMAALHDVREKLNTTVIIVTHDMDIAAQTDRIMVLVDGRVASDDPRSTAQMTAIDTLRAKRATGEISAVRLDR
jgi:putative ABC transport system ATP-binding protein